ncbi:uncharacterized protein LOC111338800 [Stylophora pistillata]|uniref:Sterile alpha motif domain-containing protein 9-like n=1 Tax=Stylophora pistillata TaxID=50429 RepID=A0A2B4RRV1_STYPI|nr:uncharacterized protein LOC111338800 [Stylophora pistillata]XP_022801066.1 uncharacterized protein LOC111338800 [Stylophora pistillata]PFX18985.1 Sterile alpha motif domain-containing protein 9-like [Stylophora pistillata]
MSSDSVPQELNSGLEAGVAIPEEKECAVSLLTKEDNKESLEGIPNSQNKKKNKRKKRKKRKGETETSDIDPHGCNAEAGNTGPHPKSFQNEQGEDESGLHSGDMGSLIKESEEVVVPPREASGSKKKKRKKSKESVTSAVCEEEDLKTNNALKQQAEKRADTSLKDRSGVAEDMGFPIEEIGEVVIAPREASGSKKKKRKKSKESVTSAVCEEEDLKTNNALKQQAEKRADTSLKDRSGVAEDMGFPIEEIGEVVVAPREASGSKKKKSKESVTSAICEEEDLTSKNALKQQVEKQDDASSKDGSGVTEEMGSPIEESEEVVVVPREASGSKKKKKKKKKKNKESVTSAVCEEDLTINNALKQQAEKQDDTSLKDGSVVEAKRGGQEGEANSETLIEGNDSVSKRIESKDQDEVTASGGDEKTAIVPRKECETCIPKNKDEKAKADCETTIETCGSVSEDGLAPPRYPSLAAEHKDKVGGEGGGEIEEREEKEEEKESVETDSDDDPSGIASGNEERNILCIFKLIYGVGLRTLRKLFMDFNPGWSDKPTDAAGFDKWKMKLSRDDEVIFNKGNINEWDFSLMTTVLLYSKSCALEISKRPGFDKALQELKTCRNKVLGHPSSERMLDADFNVYWPLLTNLFGTLGADPTEIAEIKLQTDEALNAGGHYKQLFLTEKAKFTLFGQKLDTIDSKLDAILANQPYNSEEKTPVSPKTLSGRNWDQWLKFCDAVGDFDTRKNQYILVTSALSPKNLDCFSILRCVPWKMVLDFDPMSEEKGFYREFTSQEGKGSLVSMITPAEVKGSTMANLIRQIDPNKIQWLFVNGRASDTAGDVETFSDWEATSVKEISRIFGCCCDPDKFDKQKPVICVILPYSQESIPYLEVTLCRLFENFNDQFNLKIASFKQEKRLSVFMKVKVRTVDLSPELVHLGLKELLCGPSSQRYRMPTSQAKVYADLSERDYLFLKENLDILYLGCEELPETSNDPSGEEQRLQNFLDEHKKLFISGSEISFASLYDNHDAKREIERDIQVHVQRLLDKGLTRSMIVDIKHSPGTGGTTIARRVMWDLHKFYPCAFTEIRSHLYFDEDSSYACKLADRIGALEEICHTSPVVLIDGNQSRLIEGLSNKLVRMLCNRGKRALLLRCQHGSKTSSKDPQELSRVHQVFYVDVSLEESPADLNEFQSKYKEFVERSVSGLCRVFHFPLLAMVQSFRPKLKKIVDDTWNEMESLQRQIAIVVALLQKYGNQATPALLLYDAFQRYIRPECGKNVTYSDIKQLFSEHLLNLMVPSNPWLGMRRGRKYSSKELPPEEYTFQHRLVAEMLLKKCFQEQAGDLFQVVNQFLHFPIFQRDDFLPLFEELFVFNKEGQRVRKFSVLFEELKAINPERAADVFCEVAEKTGDSIIFANAARFFAKMEPPLFEKAMELIGRAFQAKNFKQRFKSICHMKGVVMYFELQHRINNGIVKDLIELEDLANRVLEVYREARTFPPTYPNPLIGEVDVWLACIKWITKNICRRDSERTLKFLANQCPPFFRTCVSDSFYLLDIVDGIVQSVPTLADPAETQRKCSDARLSLITMLGPNYSRGPTSSRGRIADDVVQVCQALCSSKNFPRSSAVELKRLQAHFILNSSDQIVTLKQDHLVFLLQLLEELVFKENEHRLAYHLMKVCVLVNGSKRYSLEQGLSVTEKWLEVSHHGCLPYFYQMAICFLKILDGHAMEFMPKYLTALNMCREKSQNHCRSSQSTLFVSNEGEGMPRLLTRSTLFRDVEETDYSTTDISETVSRFWSSDSRKKLMECKGRIRMEPSGNRGKTYPYIELLQGKVTLYVGKNADIGKVDRNFDKGQLVYFVVSFNLHGPVANGITFSPYDSSRHLNSTDH